MSVITIYMVGKSRKEFIETTKKLWKTSPNRPLCSILANDVPQQKQHAWAWSCSTCMRVSAAKVVVRPWSRRPLLVALAKSTSTCIIITAISCITCTQSQFVDALETQVQRSTFHSVYWGRKKSFLIDGLKPLWCQLSKPDIFRWSAINNRYANTASACP